MRSEASPEDAILEVGANSVIVREGDREGGFAHAGKAVEGGQRHCAVRAQLTFDASEVGLTTDERDGWQEGDDGIVDGRVGCRRGRGRRNVWEVLGMGFDALGFFGGRR